MALSKQGGKNFMPRGLTGRLLPSLKSGILEEILKNVQNDDTLCIEIRQDYINIYYRGGNILKIEETNNEFKTHFAEKYLSGVTTVNIKALPKKLQNQADVVKWINAIPSIKHEMDHWFYKHPKCEREFQQLVVWENNCSPISNCTDYFIIDIEYANREGARFDMVAIEWESDANKRKLYKGYLPKLACIEMKYGDNALKGESGLIDHIKQLKQFFSNKVKKNSFLVEMIEILRQKRKLDLIPGLKGKSNEVKKLQSKIDVIFLLANHDPASVILQNELNKIQSSIINEPLPFELKFCTSNFMGYGLYVENIYSLNKFIRRYNKQIYNKG